MAGVWMVGQVPARLQGEEATFAFRNTFLDTLLFTDYKKGEATFRSDSITTLAIVKEVVTKEATARKIQIQIQASPSPRCVGHHLQSRLRGIPPTIAPVPAWPYPHPEFWRTCAISTGTGVAPIRGWHYTVSRLHIGQGRTLNNSACTPLSGVARSSTRVKVR